MRPDDGFDLRAARRQYWLLHWGLPPDRELRVEAPRGTPPVVAALGTLVNLELRIARGPVSRWWPDQVVHLATDAAGRALFLLSAGGVTLPDGWARARIVAVTYDTNKAGDDAHWRHAFEGTRPCLERDRDGCAVIRRRGSRFRVTWRGIVG